MVCATHFRSDDALRSILRERPLPALLARLVGRQLEAADFALARGDLVHAAYLEEAVALARHRLGLLEDALVGIVHGRRAGTL